MTTPEDASQKKQQEWLEIFVSATGTTETTEEQSQETDKRILESTEAESSSSQ